MKARVLIVDDQLTLRMVYRGVLRDLPGYELEFIDSHDGGPGLAILEALAIDLVLVDFHMLRMDGDEFVKRARAQGYRGPIILVTGEPRSVFRDAILQDRDVNYLQKPITGEAYEREQFEGLLRFHVMTGLRRAAMRNVS